MTDIVQTPTPDEPEDHLPVPVPAAAGGGSNQPPTTSREQDASFAIVLFGEGLIDLEGFAALSGHDPQDVDTLLADPERATAIEKLRLQMLHDGRLYRVRSAVEAYRGLDEVVNILRDPESSATNKIEAQRLLARGGGVEKPPEADRPAAVFQLNIIRRGQDGAPRRTVTITAPHQLPRDESGDTP